MLYQVIFESLSKLSSEIKKFENDLIEHENAYVRLFSTKSQQPTSMALTASDRRQKKETVLTAVSSAKRLPPLIDRAETPRKGRSPL